MKQLKLLLLAIASGVILTIMLLWLLGPPPWTLSPELLERGKARAALADQAVKDIVALAGGSLQPGTPSALTLEAPTITLPRPTSATASKVIPAPSRDIAKPDAYGVQTPSPLTVTNTPLSVEPSRTLAPTETLQTSVAVVPDTPEISISETPRNTVTAVVEAIVGSATPAALSTATEMAAATPSEPSELATAVPLPTNPVLDAPTSMPLPADGFYIVQAGDTLASIAARYGITTDSILAAKIGRAHV
jgi:LysM repeat protein